MKVSDTKEGKQFAFPSLVLFGWLNNQIDRRQINKRESNLVLCTWEPPPRNSQRPHICERLRTGRGTEAYTRHSELRAGKAPWGFRGEEGRCRGVRRAGVQ